MITMNDPLLFTLGVVITIVTVTALVLVGRSEAEDRALSRTGDPD